MKKPSLIELQRKIRNFGDMKRSKRIDRRALLVAFGRVISATIIGSRQVRNLILIQGARISRISSVISGDRSNSCDNASNVDVDERSLHPAGMHFPGFRAYAQAEEGDEECTDMQTNLLLTDSPLHCCCSRFLIKFQVTTKIPPVCYGMLSEFDFN